MTDTDLDAPDDIERHYFGVCPDTGMEIKVTLGWDADQAAAAARAPVALTEENGIAPQCPVCVTQHLLVEVTAAAAAWLAIDADERDYARPGMPPPVHYDDADVTFQPPRADADR